MSYKKGCLICGFELTYLAMEEQLLCEYCGRPFATDVCCANRHYICDRCHCLTANDLIEQYCRTTRLADPSRIVLTLMKSPQIKMHGPEHHFLVPAALLAAWYNRHKNTLRKDAAIIMARRRAEEVKGGVCGSHGACGAAIGTGIFISLITGATPVSKEEWRLANLMSAESLKIIAENGGPRCCKRYFPGLDSSGQFSQGAFRHRIAS